jgi:hypothetical protein
MHTFTYRIICISTSSRLHLHSLFIIHYALLHCHCPKHPTITVRKHDNKAEGVTPKISIVPNTLCSTCIRIGKRSKAGGASRIVLVLVLVLCALTLSLMNRIELECRDSYCFDIEVKPLLSKAGLAISGTICS